MPGARVEPSNRLSRLDWVGDITLDGVGASVFDDHPQTASKLWDAVDEDWTRALPNDTHGAYLSKIVYKCSACRHCVQAEKSGHKGVPLGQRDGVIRSHIDGVIRKCESHREPEMQEGYCVSCPSSERVRIGSRYDLLEHASQFSNEVRKAHEGATQLLMRRYHIAPPGPAKAGQEHMPESLTVRTLERSRRKRGRRGRGRRRK